MCYHYLCQWVDRQQFEHMVISATEPDWSREYPRSWWDPSRMLLRAIRRYQTVKGPLAALRRKYWVLQHRFWTVITQADIPLNSLISGGLVLPHPNGIVVHPKAIIGPNCMIFQQVTLGTSRGKIGLPIIGGHVDIGAGAKVLGPVKIGDHAAVAANAVVLQDVPAGAVAAGVPARIVRHAQEDQIS